MNLTGYSGTTEALLNNLNLLACTSIAAAPPSEENNNEWIHSTSNAVLTSQAENLLHRLHYNGDNCSPIEAPHGIATNSADLLTQPLQHYGVETSLHYGEDIIDLLSEPQSPLSLPMRHSPFYHRDPTTANLQFSNPSTQRPLFTRSQSVPDQHYLQQHDSADEELLLEAAAATLDDPLPITPSALQLQNQLSFQLNPSLAHNSKARLYRPVDHLAAATTTSRAYSRLSLSSDLIPTSRRSAAAQDRQTLLRSELEAAALASRRLTKRPKRNEPLLTLGRSLQLVTERHQSQLSANKALAQQRERNLNKAVSRFESEEWRLANRHLLNDVTLFPSGRGIDADAWMSVEDVTNGRWARWDALVKQESIDSQTRDSGIETGSCFTSSEDSHSEYFHTSAGPYYHHSHAKKVC